ncbi:MAG: DUF502 domain-containing protein [Bdellovibrionales bacterium]|nr:DUF502 domain-containing protein [Bdellovibrionales bacterium]
MKNLQSAFVKGLLAVLPLTATVFLLMWLVRTAEGAFGGFIETHFPNTYIPGMGLLIVLALILSIGLLLDAWIARRFLSWAEQLFESLPVIKSIYKPMKDLMGLFSSGKDKGLSRVVQVDFADGKKLIGLVTREKFEDLKLQDEFDGRVAVFFPMSYQLGGITMMVKRDQIKELNLSVDRALNLMITGWVKKPD